MRTAPHSETGITPAMALYGRELKTGILEVPQHKEEKSLNERKYSDKRQTAQKAMKAISSILTTPTRLMKQLKGKVYQKGEVVRIHRNPSPKMKYISKWRNLNGKKKEKSWKCLITTTIVSSHKSQARLQ